MGTEFGLCDQSWGPNSAPIDSSNGSLHILLDDPRDTQHRRASGGGFTMIPGATVNTRCEGIPPIVTIESVPSIWLNIVPDDALLSADGRTLSGTSTTVLGGGQTVTNTWTLRAEKYH